MRKLHTLALCTALSLLTSFASAQTPDAPTAQAPTAQAPIEQNNNFSKEALTNAYKAQNWNETIRQAEALLLVDPNNADILSLQGVAYAHTLQHEKALKAFERAWELNPKDPQIKVSMCGVQNNMKHANAIETCIEASKLAPDNANLRHLTGTLLEDAKRLPEAREHFAAAYQISPKSAVYLTALTSVDFKLGNNQETMKLLEEAIQSNFANNPIIWLNLTAACIRSTAYEKAIDYATKGYEKFRDHYMIADRAEAYLALGKFDEASKDLESVITKFTAEAPGATKTQFIYARTQLALTCHGEDYKTCATDHKATCCGLEGQALTILKKVSQSKVFTPNTLPVYLGLAHILNGNLKEAEAILTKATSSQIDKDNASALAALAVTLYSFNDARDKTAALRLYQQAVNASPDFANPQTIRTTRGWPLRTIETLEKIQADINARENAKNNPTGCSCDLQNHHSSFPMTAALLALLSLLGLGTLRRKA